MPRYYTRVTKLTGLAQIARDRGMDLALIMRDVGIDPAALRTPEAVIDYGAFCELLQRCAIRWDLPDLGLRMIRYQQIDVLGPVSLLTRMELSLRSALNALSENLVIHANAMVVVLDEPAEGDVVSIVATTRPGGPHCRENSELVLAQCKMVVDSICGRPVPYVEASFVEGQGGSASAAAAWFGCPVSYGAERNALSFARSLLDRPIERSDLAYHALIRRYLKTARTELEGGLVEEVRNEIGRQTELGHCSLESVADSFRMAPRSLQRRLQNEGHSYRDLLDEWRRGRALSLVTNTRLPLAEVSDALGYSEQSVFTQAFQRWYGATPQRCRVQGSPPT